MKSKFDPQKHHRRSIRLKNYDYASNGAYYVTIVTWGRECLFGEIQNTEMKLNELGEIVREEWKRTAEVRPYVKLGEYIIMPNHVHGILFINYDDDVGVSRRLTPTEKQSISPTPGSLGAIMAQFKSIVTKRINALHNITGVPVWQRNYYEHIIRNQKELKRKTDYILDNPARWDEDAENPIKR